jgi:hypothetical protein
MKYCVMPGSAYHDFSNSLRKANHVFLSINPSSIAWIRYKNVMIYSKLTEAFWISDNDVSSTELDEETVDKL